MARKRSVASAFGAEEEEDQPRRRLIPLQYSAEELKAAKAANAAAAGMCPLRVHVCRAACSPDSSGFAQLASAVEMQGQTRRRLVPLEYGAEELKVPRQAVRLQQVRAALLPCRGAAYVSAALQGEQECKAAALQPVPQGGQCSCARRL